MNAFTLHTWAVAVMGNLAECFALNFPVLHSEEAWRQGWAPSDLIFSPLPAKYQITRKNS